MSRSATILLASCVGLIGCSAIENGTGDDDATEPRAASSSSDCRVEFDDSWNQSHSIIDVESDKHDGELFFSVYDEDKDMMIEAQFDGRNSPIETDANVPPSTLNEIRRRFKPYVKTLAASGEVLIDHQLQYTLLPGAECSRDEFALILFFVEEWLYFG
jgi:hypothetical protein